MGLYVYGVVSTELAASLVDEKLVGLADGGPVGSVASGDLAMLVSPIHLERPLPLRHNLNAHFHVLRTAFARGTVIPLKFGNVAGSRSQVEELLALSSAPLQAELDRLEGKMELRLLIRWDVSNVYEYLVSRHAKLRAVRDRVFGSIVPSRDDLIDLGCLFERIRDDERRSHTAKVVDALGELLVEHAEGPPRDEVAVADLALLVQRDKQREIEARVHQAAALLDDSLGIELKGPWPPYSFVELQLDLPAERSSPPQVQG